MKPCCSRLLPVRNSSTSTSLMVLPPWLTCGTRHAWLWAVLRVELRGCLAAVWQIHSA